MSLPNGPVEVTEPKERTRRSPNDVKLIAEKALQLEYRDKVALRDALNKAIENDLIAMEEAARQSAEKAAQAKKLAGL